MLCRFLYLFLFCGVTACSVYKNSGRDQFESRAPNSINSAATASMEASETCWNQPANDPLWNLDSETENSENQFIVKKTNDSEIQVCTRPIE